MSIELQLIPLISFLIFAASFLLASNIIIANRNRKLILGLKRLSTAHSGMSEQDLRCERLSLTIGMIVGQLSNLLNQIGKSVITIEDVYKELLDITTSASMQINELYYKGNKPETVAGATQ